MFTMSSLRGNPRGGHRQLRDRNRVEYRGHHRAICSLARGHQHRQPATVAGGGQMGFGSQPAPRPADPVISRLITHHPSRQPRYHYDGCWRRVHGPARSVNRPRPPDRGSRPRRLTQSTRPAPDPRCRRRHNGGAVSRPSATDQTPRAARQGIPVRNRNNIPSTTWRMLETLRPTRPSDFGSNSSSSSHWLSVRT
jgi:hypothetical protein